MKTIILEGTSTSGKTVLASKLASLCSSSGINCQVVKENKTLLPILEEKDPQASLSHQIKIVEGAYDEPKKVVIFDRLHLTSLAITDCDIQKFRELENILLEHDPLVVFLEIDEKVIPQRIFGAMEHRGLSWQEYINKKGVKREIIRHYIETQRKIRQYFDQTKLPKIKHNTTNNNFDQIAQDIFEEYIK